jgi:hypothetical protein
MSAIYSDAEREALSQLPEHFSGIFDGPLPPSVEWLEDFRRRIEGSRIMVRSYGHKKSAKWRTQKHVAAIPHALIVAAAVEREQQRLAEREARL